MLAKSPFKPGMTIFVDVENVSVLTISSSYAYEA
jgi:hypothetical protein